MNARLLSVWIQHLIFFYFSFRIQFRFFSAIVFMNRTHSNRFHCHPVFIQLVTKSKADAIWNGMNLVAPLIWNNTLILSLWIDNVNNVQLYSQFPVPTLQNVNSEHQGKDDKNVMSPTFCNWKWDFTWPNIGNKTKMEKTNTRQPIILTENDVSHSVGILDDVDLMELH